MKINNVHFDMVFDTGAELSLINEKTFKKLQASSKVELRSSRRKLRAYGGSTIHVIGEIEVELCDFKQSERVRLIVKEGDCCIFDGDLIAMFMPSFEIILLVVIQCLFH